MNSTNTQDALVDPEDLILDKLMDESDIEEIIENWGIPTREELEKNYKELFGEWRARGRNIAQLIQYRKDRRWRNMKRAGRHRSARFRQHLRVITRLATRASARKRAVISGKKTNVKAKSFLKRTRGKAAKFMHRRKSRSEKARRSRSRRRMAASVEYANLSAVYEFVDFEKEQNYKDIYFQIVMEEAEPDEVAALLIPNGADVGSNLYFFGMELSDRLFNDSFTKDKYFDWDIDEIDGNHIVLLYFTDAKDAEALKKIEEMLNGIGESEIVIREGDEIEVNVLSDFTVFAFVPDVETFVAFREQYEDAVDYEYWSDMFEMPEINAQLTESSTVADVTALFKKEDVSVFADIASLMNQTDNYKIRNTIRDAKIEIAKKIQINFNNKGA